jgi:hypothetical protein
VQFEARGRGQCVGFDGARGHDGVDGHLGQRVQDRLQGGCLAFKEDCAEADQHERFVAGGAVVRWGLHDAGVAYVGRQSALANGVEVAVGRDQDAIGGVPHQRAGHGRRVEADLIRLRTREA